MLSDIVILILEIIGTISFAVSGAFVAIKAKLDLFGVTFIGTITAVGGGIVRDILIGRFPPAIFTNFPIFAAAAASSLLVFLLAYVYRQRFSALQERIERFNTFFDAVGLAAFTIMGTEVAFSEALSENMFLSVTLGMLTGVGGGIFRDILTDSTPYIFKKHVYALTSILGACLYYALRHCTVDPVLPSVSAMLFIVIMRLLAARYRWSLPRIKDN